MTLSPSPAPADVGTLRRLYREELLNPEAHRAALALVRPAEAWFSWARRMLLFFGAALVLAGIIFFFAYNWQKMGRFYTLGVIQGAILACIGAGHWKGLDETSGKVFVCSAAVLVGVLLAVYGQIYQTGADAYELFIGWALLIVGWAVVARFSALWLVWMGVVNTGLILYWSQVGRPLYGIRYEYLCLLTAAINGAGLAVFEIVAGRASLPVRDRWLRWILVLATLIPLSLPTLEWILNFGRGRGAAMGAAAVWAAAIAGGYRFYRVPRPDMIPLALMVMNGCVVVLTLIGKALLHDAGFGEAGVFLMLGLIILAVVSLAAVWLKKTAATMAEEEARRGP